jgi:hypothetical protein
MCEKLCAQTLGGYLVSRQKRYEVWCRGTMKDVVADRPGSKLGTEPLQGYRSSISKPNQLQHIFYGGS